jgi:hypothetical protein
MLYNESKHNILALAGKTNKIQCDPYNLYFVKQSVPKLPGFEEFNISEIAMF